MAEVLVTGIGLISSIGNDPDTVARNTRQLRHGIEHYDRFDDPKVPVNVLGTVKGFDTSSRDAEDWTYPESYRVSRDMLRSMCPHALYAYCAVCQALDNARLTRDAIIEPRTGLYTASPGSTRTLYHHLDQMLHHGVARCSPMGVVSSVVGTLSFNLVAHFKIEGSSCGFASACASSGHALGFAWDEIASGRQDRMIVVGGEDGDLENILPFAGMRALTTSSDPDSASRPFDKNRSGFVGTGGAVAIVLESAEAAKARNAEPYARFIGWGQASDGHNVAISHPEGSGLVRAMTNALSATGLEPKDVDYINAHAASTQIGDLSEARAMQDLFGQLGEAGPLISSTKALTGHGLSMASVLEAAICCLSLREGFTPGSAHITELDPGCAGLNILRETRPEAPGTVMSNSSGFGGANVSLLFRKLEA